MESWPIFVIIELCLNVLALPIFFELGRVTNKIGGPWQQLWAWMFAALLLRLVLRLAEFGFDLSGPSMFIRGLPAVVFLSFVDIGCWRQLCHLKRFLATPGVLEKTAANTHFAFSSSLERLTRAAKKLGKAIEGDENDKR